MTARLPFLALLALASLAQAQVRPEDCATQVQPVVAVAEDGYLVAHAPIPAHCAERIRVAGWEVSADGRTFEPAHQTALLADVTQDGGRLRAQAAAGMYLFRPVLATPEDQLFAASHTTINLADAGSTAGKLRLPGGKESSGKAASANAKGGSLPSIGGPTGTGSDGRVWTAQDGAALMEQSAPAGTYASGGGVGGVSKGGTPIGFTSGGASTAGTATGMGGGGARKTGSSGSSAAAATTSAQASAETPAVALACAKKFLLLGENNSLATKVPVQVMLTYMKNEEANCGGTTQLQTIFMASLDNRNYVPLEQAGSILGGVNYVRNNIADRATFQLNVPGTFYFRAISKLGTGSAGSGVYKVTAR
jgi:hypothetical protein